VVQTPEQRAAAERMRLAFDLHEAGVSIMRARLRREHPHEDDTEIDARLKAWLHTRPGAELGDAEGIPRSVPPAWR
jgi:hypothetical protein